MRAVLQKKNKISYDYGNLSKLFVRPEKSPAQDNPSRTFGLNDGPKARNCG